MQPVWVLSVDLQTKTATFQSGLRDAASSARGAFGDIRSGANQMGAEVGRSSGEARHGIMLLGEEFGVHLPRGITTFLASLGPVAAAMEAAFPFLAIAVGATLLLEHLAKMRAEGQQLTQDQVKFGTATLTAFNTLDEKLRQAAIRADELSGNHLEALKLKLESIDHASMNELVHAFDEVAKAADVVFKDLNKSWIPWENAAGGASNALEEFKNQYNSLLAQGKNQDASDLLKGTRDSAQHILDMQRQYIANSGTMLSAPKAGADYFAALRAASDLKKADVGVSEKEVWAQQILVTALNDQLTVEGKIAAIKKLDSGNAGKEEGNAGAARKAEAARQEAEMMQRLGASAIAGDRAVAEAQLTIHRGTIEQRLALDLDFAQRELDVKLAANQAEIAGLDKGGKDYINKLHELQGKALELTAAHDAEVASLTSRAQVAEYQRDLSAVEQGEREKIAATQQGSRARIAALDAAIAEQHARGLSDTTFVRELLNQRVEAVRQEAQEEAKLHEAMGKEEAENAEKMGALLLAAEKLQQQLRASARRGSEQQRLMDERANADAEYQLKMQAFQREEAALDKNAKDYQLKLKALQDKETQLTRQHENEISSIKEKAEEERNRRILAAKDQFNNAIAQGLTQSIMGHESWAKMVTSLGDQVVSGMLQNAIKSILADDATKERDAAKAARDAFKIGMGMGPAGIVLGPVFGAAAFTAVMAFQGGTDSVPGVGSGDIVPAMLEPGEGVVPKGVMEGLNNVARNGGFNGGGQTTHVHVRPTYHVQTIDGNGMQAALEKHTDVLQRHFESAVRKMNR